MKGKDQDQLADDAVALAARRPEETEDVEETLHVVEMPGPPDEDPIRESIITDDWGRSMEEPHRETEVPGLVP